MSIVNVKNALNDTGVIELLIPSVYNPTPQRLLSRVRKYQKNENIGAYAYFDNGGYKGIVVFEINGQTATVLDIAVKLEEQGKGIGSRLIDFVFSQFEVSKVVAETDDDAIGFYKKCGFAVIETRIYADIKRYMCVRGTNRM